MHKTGSTWHHRGGFAVPASDRRGKWASPSLLPAAEMRECFGRITALAAALGISGRHAQALIYGDAPWPEHLARKLEAIGERKIAQDQAVIELARALQAEAVARAAKRRQAARQRFHDRWGFWPETKADKSARWAKMKGPPSSE